MQEPQEVAKDHRGRRGCSSIEEDVGYLF